MMHNPFGLLSVKLFRALVHAGQRYFVRQSYPRGFNPLDPALKRAFLFSHYEKLSDAQMHFDLIDHDRHRFLYDCHNPEHFERLERAALQVPGWPVYSPLLQKPWQPSEKMAELIRRYIAQNLDWTPAREELVKAALFTQFGELFVTLKYQSHETSVLLADIEKS